MSIDQRKQISLPLKHEDIISLCAGDAVSITGYLYTARDAAHRKIVEILSNGGKLPFELSGSVIYYAGPCPAKPGEVIGSAGPTTSTRMDKYTPFLLKQGLKAMIGKGQRSEEVIDSMVENGAVYFGATGGAGALISESIKSSEVVAFQELGTEAVRKIYVEKFPAIVLIDRSGKNIYKTGREKYFIDLKISQKL